jgi:diguanylate cyclase (GGDEF)-like protein/PAS domain S-box-containing protein
MTDTDNRPTPATPLTERSVDLDLEQTRNQPAKQIVHVTATQSLEAIATTVADGSPVGCVTLNDTTLGRQVESLRDSLARFKAIIDDSLDWQSWFGLDGRYLWVNPAVEQMTGYTPAEVMAMPDWVSVLIAEEDWPIFRETFREAISGSEGTGFEIRYVRKDGVKRWISVDWKPVVDEQGRRLGIRASGRDITDLKLTEAALRRSQTMLSRAEVIAHLGSWEWEVATDAVTWSDELFRIFQRNPAEGAPSFADHAQLYVPEDMQKLREAVEAAITQGTPYELELRAIRQDGTLAILLAVGHVDIGAEQQVTRLFGSVQDVTERRAAERALRDSEQRFHAIFTNAPLCILIHDADTGEMLDANPTACALYGFDSVEALRAASSQLWLDPPYSAADAVRWANKTLHEGPQQFEWRYRCADGTTIWEWVHLSTIEMQGKTHILAMTVDITREKQIQADLQASEIRYRALFDHISSGVAIYEARDQGQTFVFRDYNHAAARISGLTRDALLGQSLIEVFPGIEAFGLLEVLRRVWATGTAEHLPARVYQDARLNRWYDNYVYRLPTGEVVAVFDDVTALKDHERQLEHLAYSDSLTALPNRVLLLDRLQHAMAQSLRREQHLAVVYLDLDGFKAVNDCHGHAAGDQLLMKLSRRMKQTLRESDTLARLGGDEFVAVLVDLGDQAAGVPLLNRLLAAVCAPVPLGGEVVVQVSASLGVTYYPQLIPDDHEGTEALDADQLLRQADQAMYQAKRAGKNRYHVFDVEKDRRQRGQQDSLERLRHALAEHEFVLYYQPKINLRTGAVIGAEALIRWQHPERGFLIPKEFLPAIEDDPLAVELGEWVIETALTQMDDWRTSGVDLPVSINIGLRQLQQTDFVARLRARLAAHPEVKPSSLTLEILETSAVQNLAHVTQVVADCHALGVSCALDDFGVGYSSLTYLKHLAVTTLKIDRSFVSDMLDNPDDLAIIESILGLALAFRRQAIAEGVETLEQGEKLLQLGCELAQGFRIAHPMPAHELPGWLADWRPPAHWTDLLLGRGGTLSSDRSQ